MRYLSLVVLASLVAACGGNNDAYEADTTSEVLADTANVIEAGTIIEADEFEVQELETPEEGAEETGQS
jgi:hypothetical protein